MSPVTRVPKPEEYLAPTFDVTSKTAGVIKQILSRNNIYFTSRTSKPDLVQLFRIARLKMLEEYQVNGGNIMAGEGQIAVATAVDYGNAVVGEGDQILYQARLARDDTEYGDSAHVGHSENEIKTHTAQEAQLAITPLTSVYGSATNHASYTPSAPENGSHHNTAESSVGAHHSTVEQLNEDNRSLKLRTQVVEAENTRIQESNHRLSAEFTRVEAYRKRIFAKYTHTNDLYIQANAKNTRIIGCYYHAQAENTRLVAENTHLVAENNRLVAEDTCINNSYNQAAAENTRINDLYNHVAAENARINNLYNHVATDNDRINNLYNHVATGNDRLRELNTKLENTISNPQHYNEHISSELGDHRGNMEAGQTGY